MHHHNSVTLDVGRNNQREPSPRACGTSETGGDRFPGEWKKPPSLGMWPFEAGQQETMVHRKQLPAKITTCKDELSLYINSCGCTYLVVRLRPQPSSLIVLIFPFPYNFPCHDQLVMGLNPWPLPQIVEPSLSLPQIPIMTLYKTKFSSQSVLMLSWAQPILHLQMP